MPAPAAKLFPPSNHEDSSLLTRFLPADEGCRPFFAPPFFESHHNTSSSSSSLLPTLSPGDVRRRPQYFFPVRENLERVQICRSTQYVTHGGRGGAKAPQIFMELLAWVAGNVIELLSMCCLYRRYTYNTSTVLYTVQEKRGRSCRHALQFQKTNLRRVLGSILRWEIYLLVWYSTIDS